MYQFYYADREKINKKANYQKDIKEFIDITAVRPTMWEEHCLECSAPICFKSCLHYQPRKDGRCMRFQNGIFVYRNLKGCMGQAARVKFRKWANMMTILYPTMLSVEKYHQMTHKYQKLGKSMMLILNSRLPISVRWSGVRTIEFLRRKKLCKMAITDNKPDAFVFHGFSFEEDSVNLIMEIFDDHTPVFKTAICLDPGENIHILSEDRLSKACQQNGYLVKIYPENDKEIELDILWCDFVKGKLITASKPADKVKCVVWDLDNTIWNGILIETENHEALKLREHVLDTIKALDERGIIQSIASKNDYENAWQVIEKLGIDDYFLYPQIHWNAKSASMEEIAKSLNIGIDALALIDDSDFERNQVHSTWNQVRVYSEKEIENLLLKPEFNVMITEESKNRRKMYRSEEKRNQLMKLDNTNMIEFIKKCNFRVEIFEPVTEEEINRCFELVVRTNQLNMSGNKYSREEFEKVLEKIDSKNFAFSCQDDFGSYGIVGYGQYRIERRVMIFQEFAMSCRVAGKYVESALFQMLLRREGCNEGKFEVLKTKKNILLRRTLEEIGFHVEKEFENRIRYQFNGNLKNKGIIMIESRE